MIGGIGLAAPWALALLLVPLAATRLLRPRPSEGAALRVPASVAAGDGGERALTRLRASALLPWFVWGALVLAVAGPERSLGAPALPASGRDVMLVIDVSGSMEREDFTLAGQPVARIGAVQTIAARFVRGRPGDRMGVVVFGDRAELAAPLTFDVEAVAAAIERIEIGLAGRSTAISDGLGLAMKRLLAAGAPGRVAILLSDGSNTAGAVDPLDAAALAAEVGVRVHTIALGPDPDDPRADARNLVDEATLAAIASESGGTAFRVRSTADLEAVSAEIDRLEARGLDLPPSERRRALWVWPAGLALLLAGFHVARGRLGWS